jgi:hypothetical protein
MFYMFKLFVCFCKGKETFDTKNKFDYFFYFKAKKNRPKISLLFV